ncbi:MAG TPA: hypothetical protein DF296_10685 [Candidatus Margulisbacteria bacterium]|nr:hypothetical protein [Candidatus Margulisiibacteriota bacterium]
MKGLPMLYRKIVALNTTSSLRETPKNPIFIYYSDEQIDQVPYQFVLSSISVAITSKDGVNTVDITHFPSPNRVIDENDVIDDYFMKRLTPKQLEQFLFVYDGELRKISFDDLRYIYYVQKDVRLFEISPIYYEIIKALDGPVKFLCLSDIHGAASKTFNALTLFPQAKVIFSGDLFDRAQNQHHANCLFQNFYLHGISDNEITVHDNEYFKSTMGNHDAMVFGAGLGDLTSLAHYFRFALRYNESDYFEEILGLDLSELKDLASKHEYRGNYKAKGGDRVAGVEMNRRLEALFTDLQLKLTFGDPSVTLTEDESNLLYNLKFGINEKSINDPVLQALQYKIAKFAITEEETALLKTIKKKEVKTEEQENFLANIKSGTVKNKLISPVFLTLQEKIFQLKFMKEEQEIIGRIKKGNHYISSEEMVVLADLQKQLIKNSEFRKSILMGKYFKLYDLQEANGKNFLFFHSNIPIDKNGQIREIAIDGRRLGGIELLDYLQQKINESYDRYEKLNINNEQEVDEFIAFARNQNNYFDWLAWSYDSPLYGRVMKTFERSYLPEESGTYKEPKDDWYQKIQNASANMEHVNSMLATLAGQLGVPADNLFIINGHTPNDQGLVEKFADGRLIRIDAGFSPEYNNLGQVLLITEKGTLYSLSLSEDNDVIEKYTLQKV